VFTTRGIYILSSLILLFSISWILSDTLFITAFAMMVLTMSVEGFWFQRSLRSLREVEVAYVVEGDRTFIGEVWKVAARIRNTSGSISSLIEVWLPIPDSFHPLSENPSLIRGLKGGRETLLQYLFKPLESGDYRVEGILLRIYDPCLLFWSERIIPKPLQVKVLPRIPSPKIVEVLEIYPVYSSGMKVLTGKSRGMEFEGIRQYSPGDDIRHIAWKATAKSPTHELMTKELEDKSLRRLVVAVPSHTGMGDGRIGERKIDKIVETALSLAYTALSTGDKVSIFYQKDGEFPSTPWLTHRDQLYIAVDALYNLEPRGNVAWETFVDRISRSLGERALILLFVDASYPNRFDMEKLGGLRVLGHSIHIFLLDNRRFIGVDCQSDEASEFLLRVEGEHFSNIVTSCIKAGIPYSTCGPEDLLEKSLKVYGELMELMTPV
jgi:uncharacterized protein (DUF58 family)